MIVLLLLEGERDVIYTRYMLHIPIRIHIYDMLTALTTASAEPYFFCKTNLQAL